MNTRKLSSTQEKRLAKNIGGRQVIGSGSTPFLKGDVITSDLFIEAKTKAVESKSISVKKAWLEKAQEQAYSMRKKDYALAISFGDGKDYYVIEDSLMEDLYKSTPHRRRLLRIRMLERFAIWRLTMEEIAGLVIYAGKITGKYTSWERSPLYLDTLIVDAGIFL